MSKRAYERRLRAKRERERHARRRAQRMRKIRIASSVAAALVIGLALFLAFRGGGGKPVATPTASPTPSPSPTGSPSPAPCTTPGPQTIGKKTFAAPPCDVINRDLFYLAKLTTSMGPITLKLDPRLAPKTVNNFVFLARQGFYDGVGFHRIEDEPTFAIVQGGDPKGDGSGGPGYDFDGEVPPPTAKYTKGVVAMAKPQAKFPGELPQNGSQFFIVVRDWNDLPPEYTIFGEVIETAESFATLQGMIAAKAPGSSSPKEPIVITKVTIEELTRT